MAPIHVTIQGAVYAAASRHVKNRAHTSPQGQFAARLAGLLLAVLSANGCTAPVRIAWEQPWRGHLLVMRYAVEPLYGLSADGIQALVERDLETIRRLGIEAVLAAHVDDANRRMLMSAAEAAGLALILPDRVIAHYVRTGHVDDTYGSWQKMTDARCRSLPPGAPVLAMDIGYVANDEAARRAGAVAGQMARVAPHLPAMATLGPAVTSPPDRIGPIASIGTDRRPVRPGSGSASEPAGPPPLGKVRINQRVVPDTDTVRRWFAAYHAGLAAGMTAGVVFDSYRKVPGQWQGLVDKRGRIPVSSAAAFKQLLDRARTWGSRLTGARPQTIAGAGERDPDLEPTLLVRGRQRFVLIRNVSEERFVRGRVVLPTRLGNEPVRRLVGVPGETNALGGRVVEPTTGRLELPVDLPPGGADLYEVF
jgi:hypothetical protein